MVRTDRDEHAGTIAGCVPGAGEGDVFEDEECLAASQPTSSFKDAAVDSYRMHALDNAVWTALTTKQAQLAHSNALARRFPPEMTLLGALAANTAMAFDSLAQLIQRDAVTLYFTAAPKLPSGWETVRAVELHQ